MARASAVAEKIGIRSASIVETAFAAQFKPVARALGVSGMPFVEYPGAVSLDSDEEFVEKVTNVVVDRVVKAFATPIETAAKAEEPRPRDIVFAGSLSEVQEHFYRSCWTDGLPIIPPTTDRVEEFLQFTDRSPEEVVGTLLPARREATLWNVAVNGVMAGCRPEYMPVLLAIVEAMAEAEFGVEHAGSGPAWEPMVIVSGPIVKQLDFNYEVGAMRIGRRANTSIGRFTRLCMRNIAGLRATREETTDKGAIGFTFNVALAEHEDAVAEIGWRPFGVELGFPPGGNVVTLQSVLSISPPIVLHHVTSAHETMETIAKVWGEGDAAYWAPVGMFFGGWYPLLVLSPATAKVLAREGWTKDDIKRHLYENVKMSAHVVEDTNCVFRGRKYTVSRLVEEGKLPKEYCSSSDPNRLLPVFLRPQWIGVVVSGDPGEAVARGYTNSASFGARVSKQIKLPVRWEDLLWGPMSTRSTC